MPPGITIVGLGPGNPDQITLEAWRVIEGACEVYLRTKRHPSVSALPKGTENYSFDHLYETLGSFAEVYEEIARAIVALGTRPQGVVYAVPGHPSWERPQCGGFWSWPRPKASPRALSPG